MNLLALTLAAPLAIGNPPAPTSLIVAREQLPTGAIVTGIGAVHLGNFGTWLVQARTNDPDKPIVVLRWAQHSFPLVEEWKHPGDSVVQPVGATVAAIGSVSSELFGGVTWVARLDGTPGGTTDDEVVYYEKSIWLQEGTLGDSWSGLTNLDSDTSLQSFDDVRSSSYGGQVLFRGSFDDPTIAGPSETYMATGWLCGSVGVLCGIDVRAVEGQTAPGLSESIEAVRLTPRTAALSPEGLDVIWSCDLEGNTASDGCVYLFSYGFGNQQHELLAREGSPSPVAGRNWGPLDSPSVGVNSNGDWTLIATLDARDPATDAVLVKSGAVLAREGDVLPSVAPAELLGFGDGRALIDPDGQAVWFGRLAESGAGSEALFLDDQVLVRTGATQIDGRTLVRIRSGVDSMSLSPDGALLLFTGTLEGGVEGAFLLELDPSEARLVGRRIAAESGIVQ